MGWAGCPCPAPPRATGLVAGAGARDGAAEGRGPVIDAVRSRIVPTRRDAPSHDTTSPSRAAQTPLRLVTAFVAMATLTAAIATALLSSGPAQAALSTSPPPVRHVWIIQLENESYANVLVHSTHEYLGHTLPSLGEVLTSYYSTGHESLDNYISEVSGQAPNAYTQADCQRYINVTPGVLLPNGQAVGLGCVFPTTVKTIADQLVAKGLTWKGYMEDMGNKPARDNTNATGDCGHPILNTEDDTQLATNGDQYATRHNPFMYFHTIIDNPKMCDDVVPLTRLANDLKRISTTPNYSWITPNLCDDGHDASCAGTNLDGTKIGGLYATDLWLHHYVPMIMASPAYKANGLIIVTWDESETEDGGSCCGEIPGPGSPLPGLVGLGGGHIATILISKYIKPGSTDSTSYNHYAMLASVEDIFGLSHVGMADATGLTTFGPDVFNDYRPAATK